MSISDRNDKFFKHEVKEITFYIVLGLIMAIILPIFLGFVLEAFEESFVAGRPLQFGDFLVQFLIYYIIILGGLIGLPVLAIRKLYLIKKGEHPATQSEPKHLTISTIHNPETDGALYNLFHGFGFKDEKNPMRWSLSILRNFVIAILIFGTLGLVQTTMGFQFIGIPQSGIYQQVSPTSQVLFAAEPAAFAETTLMLFVLSLLLGELAWFTSKVKGGKIMYFVIALFIISPMIGADWMLFHTLVYGNNEAALFTTFVFGTVGAFMTILTGTFIYWYVWHFANNFFVKLSQIATSNEDIWFITIIVLVTLLVSLVTIEILLKKYKKKKEYTPETPD